jgi:hypothetical protein
MRKALKAILVLACLCLPASTQTPEACRAAVLHLTLPPTAQIDDGNGETPVEFLFSDHGDDIYSAIPSSEPNYMFWFTDHGIRVIVVYQDEQARQHAIRNLNQPGVVANVMPGSSPHGSLDHLKFAVIHLGMGSSRDKLDEPFIRTHSAKEIQYHELVSGGWHIEDIQYYEPQACVASRKNDLCLNDSDQAVPCVLQGLHASHGSPNWITDVNIIPGKPKLEPYDDPQFVKIIDAMRSKSKTKVVEPGILGGRFPLLRFSCRVSAMSSREHAGRELYSILTFARTP